MDVCGRITDNENPSIYSGNNQTWVTTRTLPQPFIVQTQGGPNNSITFTINPNNGASGSWLPINGFPTPSINGLVATVQTDSQGYATSPQLTLNGTAGSFTVTASDGINTLTFNVTSTACTTNPPVSQPATMPACTPPSTRPEPDQPSI